MRNCLNKSKTLCCGLIIFLGLAKGIFAAEPYTEHTYRLVEGEAQPTATLADVSWLVGSWAGTAFGKKFEEVWNPSSANTMLGMWKLYDDDGVSFYELMLLDAEGGSLSLKVRHFNADFSAWEDKRDYASFPLVKLETQAIHFSGLSLYRRGSDQIDAYVVQHEGEEFQEHHLIYHRR